MGIIPISARIAVRLAQLEYNRATVTPTSLGVYPRVVLRTLPLEVNSILRLALHSLGVYLDLGYTSKEWLEAVLMASHFGNSFRRCFFFDYKENRSPYPRVTNRGVQNSSKAASGRVRKGRFNG